MTQNGILWRSHLMFQKKIHRQLYTILPRYIRVENVWTYSGWWNDAYILPIVWIFEMISLYSHLFVYHRDIHRVVMFNLLTTTAASAQWRSLILLIFAWWHNDRQYWFRWWIITSGQQTSTWTNITLSGIRSNGTRQGLFMSRGF